MDLKEYYKDLHQQEAELSRRFPDGEVHVTSVYNRERNSKAGRTVSATCYNAARVITDGTHRESTAAERESFFALQERNRITAIRQEQMKKQQYVVVVDPDQPANAIASRAARTSQSDFQPVELNNKKPAVETDDED